MYAVVLLCCMSVCMLLLSVYGAIRAVNEADVRCKKAQSSRKDSIFRSTRKETEKFL